MLRWLVELTFDVVAFILGDKIPYERRAHHIAAARLYGSVAAIFIGGLAGILLIFAISERLDESAREAFSTIAGLALLTALSLVLLAYVRHVRRPGR